MQNLDEIEKLTKIISKLPGLGKKSAKRIALKLVNSKEILVKPLAKVLSQVYKNVIRCKICGNFKNQDKLCICNEPNKTKKNCVIGFGITKTTISKLKSADGLVVGSAICKEITRSLKNRQNPVTNVCKLVTKLKKRTL